MQIDSTKALVFIRYGPEITEVFDPRADHLKLIEELLKEAREVRTFLAAGRVTKSQPGEKKVRAGILSRFRGRKRKKEPWNQISLERTRQIENLMGDIELVLQLTKQREKACAKIRTQLETQISMRDIEIDRLSSELRHHAEERRKAFDVVLKKIADLYRHAASVQKYLDTCE